MDFSRKQLTAGIIGNVLEWYDFAVYAFFSPIISQVFFPDNVQSVAIIKTFLVFSIGFLVRPIGGFIFGHIGDKHGRKKAFQISIFMMGIPTVLIGLLPAYRHVGFLSPTLLVCLRLLQGISAGGELTSSTTYVFEISPSKNKNFWCSFVTFSSILGVFSGSLMATLLKFMIKDPFLSWRIAFFFGIILVIWGIYLRMNTKESNVFLEEKNGQNLKSIPALYLIKNYSLSVLKVISLNVFVSIAFYTLFVWMPTYIEVFLKKTSEVVLSINTLVMFVLILLIPLFGFFSERIGIKKIAIFGVVSYGGPFF